MRFNNIYQELLSGKTKLALVGLGYVGLPVAIEFAKYVQVIGFDVNRKRVDECKNGVDINKEIKEEIDNPKIEFTSAPTKLKEAKFIIVAVPTPAKSDHTPDLTLIKQAAQMVGENLSKGTIVVFESTVYPGVTETLCAPIIEQASNLQCGVDWKIGYSPERINPGDTLHTFANICKIISGMDEETATEIQKVYNIAVKAGTYLVSDIKTAEAVKLVENSQRDVNIAFMNEVAKLCNKLNIDTHEVVAGMNTKWNSLGFTPGLVGGHCIGVDSYYLLELANKIKCDSFILQCCRKTNESMAAYIADMAVREMLNAGTDVRKAKVVILGITFKENCSDIRTSKVIDLINRFKAYNIEPVISDEFANAELVQKMYGVNLVPFAQLPLADCVIVAVAHNSYRLLTIEKILHMYKKELANDKKILIDVKSLYRLDELKAAGIRFWRL